jgi:hypothetical protein
MTESGPAEVAVRHFSEGHRYRFLVVSVDGSRLLGEPAVFESSQHTGRAKDLRGAARFYAEDVAHRAGLIDRAASVESRLS